MVTETANCSRCGHPVVSGARFCQHCGADVSEQQIMVPTAPVMAPLRPVPQLSAADLLRQETLGEYEIQAELGRGGMATVYLAHDIALGRPVAVKVMSPAVVEEGVAERFRREARTAASLNHPHIIPIYAVRERPDLLYFVMKFIRGPSLDPILKERGALPIPMAQLVLSQAASALGYAHRRGVIHRDVKPANIMLDEDGWVVVTDFGIAKVSSATGLTMTGVTVGTPAYMSPEQCMGREVTGASDQYSLGVVAYQLITGQRPFNATSAMSMMYAHFNEVPRPLRELRPDCPPELDDAVIRMLAKDANDRWPSIDEAFGGMPVPDDSTRQSLAVLASSSSHASLVATISTPTSPVPPAKRPLSGSSSRPVSPPPSGRITRETEPPLTPRGSLQAAGAAPTPPIAEVDTSTRKLRAWLLAAFTTVALVFVAVFVWQRQPVRQAVLSPPITPPPAVDTTTQVVSRPVATDTAQPVPPTAGFASVAEVVLTPTRLALEVGRTGKVRLELRDSAGGQVNSVRRIIWTSSAPDIATVDANGTVRGNAPGSATIMVQAGGKTGRVALQVTPAAATVGRAAPVASLQLNPPTATIQVGGSVTLSAAVLDGKGNPLNDRPVSWSVNGSAINVSPDGVVTGLQPGTAVVRAESEGKSVTATITVGPAAVAEVRLSPTVDSLTVGKTAQLSATARDARGGTLADRRVSWASSDSSVATVQAGLVTARSAGVARISATIEDRVASAQITVLPPPVDPAAERARAKQEIDRTLDLFTKALNNRSVDQLKQAYPGMSTAEEGRWRSLLEEKSLVKFQASIDPDGDPRIETDGAEQRFRLLLQQTYSGRPVSNATVEYRAHFRRENGKWQMTRLQQQ